MADVFVSYKKEDRALAQQVVAAVEAAGYSVWWDDDLTPRSTWDSEIEREISAARAVLVLWTARSVAEGTFVRIEAQYAKEHGKLVPVRLQRCRLPLAFGTIQTADLSSWNREDASHAEWRRTLDWLSACIGRAAVAVVRPGGSQWRRGLIIGAAAAVALSVAAILANSALEATQSDAKASNPSPAETIANQDTGSPPAAAGGRRYDRYTAQMLADEEWRALTGLLGHTVETPAALNRTLETLVRIQLMPDGAEPRLVIIESSAISAGSLTGSRIWLTTGLLNEIDRRSQRPEEQRNLRALVLGVLLAHLHMRHDLAIASTEPPTGFYNSEQAAEALRLALDLCREAGYPTHQHAAGALEWVLLSTSTPYHATRPSGPGNTDFASALATVDVVANGYDLARVREGQFEE